MKSIATVIFLFMHIVSLRAQVIDTTEKGNTTNRNVIEDRIENIAGAGEQEADYGSLIDNLLYYREHPLSLNTASHKELAQLLLLNELQIFNLLQHISQNGPLISVYELQGISGFDLNTIYAILPYIKVNQDLANLNISWKELISNGHHQVIARSQRLNETLAGYVESVTPGQQSKQASYPGNPFKIYGRYRFTYANRYSWGITGEKDPGEITSGIKLFDYYSAHFFADNRKGIFKTIALGDYQLQFGQGLVMWSGVAFSKSPDIINVKKYGAGIRPYASADENLYRRGAAATTVYKRFEATVFYSDKFLDANGGVTDTARGQATTVTSLQQSGLHRTAAEIKDRHIQTEKMYGAHLAFKTRVFNAGITGMRTVYGLPFEKSAELYKKFDFSGNANTNIGIDYSLARRNYTVFGEFARSENGGLAMISGLLLSPDSKFSLSAVYRNYEPTYQALYAKAFGESYSTSNESGMYAGLQYKPNRSWSFTAYTDVFRFPWLNYLVDAPSAGREYFVQAAYTPSKTTQAYIRCKLSSKQKNDDIPGTFSELAGVYQDNYRFNISYKISKAVTLQHRLEYVSYLKENHEPESGFLMYQDVSYKSMRFPVSFNSRYTLFDTDSYNPRLYAYENDILYLYSIHANFYRGSSFYFNMQYRVSRIITLWLGYNLTMYDNRKTIGTGTDMIAGDKKSEIKLQLRFEF